MVGRWRHRGQMADVLATVSLATLPVPRLHPPSHGPGTIPALTCPHLWAVCLAVVRARGETSPEVATVTLRQLAWPHLRMEQGFWRCFHVCHPISLPSAVQGESMSLTISQVKRLSQRDCDRLPPQGAEPLLHPLPAPLSLSLGFKLDLDPTLGGRMSFSLWLSLAGPFSRGHCVPKPTSKLDVSTQAQFPPGLPHSPGMRSLCCRLSQTESSSE